jgi:hypothetical protein
LTATVTATKHKMTIYFSGLYHRDIVDNKKSWLGYRIQNMLWYHRFKMRDQ